jgi:hypothetical protein
MFAYTDGSFIEKEKLPGKGPRIGAAVYVPAPSGGEGQLHTYLPSNQSYKFDDTINRAELVAIKETIQLGHTKIATDSLTSIYQLDRMIKKTQDINLTFHRHADLLQTIRDAIVVR